MGIINYTSQLVKGRIITRQVIPGIMDSTNQLVKRQVETLGKFSLAGWSLLSKYQLNPKTFGHSMKTTPRSV